MSYKLALYKIIKYLAPPADAYKGHKLHCPDAKGDRLMKAKRKITGIYSLMPDIITVLFVIINQGKISNMA